MKKNINGFTLIELMIIIAIIWIFAAVAYKTIFTETVELDLNEWTCTDHGTRTVPVMVGKVLTRQERDVCVEYKRGE